MIVDDFVESGKQHMPFGQGRDEKLLETLKELFAEQNKQITVQGQLLAQQVQRLDIVSQQLTVLSTQQETLRTEWNARWNDLPKLYVPRQEHQAMGLDARATALEEFRVAATKDIADLKLTIQQQVQAAINVASQEITAQRLASQAADSQTKNMFTERQLVIAVAILTFVLNSGVAIAMRFLGH